VNLVGVLLNYSNDLRWRIVWQRIGDIFAIASNLNISLATVQRICTLEQTGNVDLE